jgi:hypothetical protein
VIRSIVQLGLVALVASCGGVADSSDASTDAFDPACTLAASSYVTTCTADTDCTAVWLGDACTSKCFCPNASINATSKPKYQSDFDATNHENNVCTCPAFPDPVCCNGQCALGCK